MRSFEKGKKGTHQEFIYYCHSFLWIEMGIRQYSLWILKIDIPLLFIQRQLAIRGLLSLIRIQALMIEKIFLVPKNFLLKLYWLPINLTLASFISMGPYLCIHLLLKSFIQQRDDSQNT